MKQFAGDTWKYLYQWTYKPLDRINPRMLGVRNHSQSWRIKIDMYPNQVKKDEEEVEFKITVREFHLIGAAFQTYLDRVEAVYQLGIITGRFENQEMKDYAHKVLDELSRLGDKYKFIHDTICSENAVHNGMIQ
jgi:hypothetical protein